MKAQYSEFLLILMCVAVSLAGCGSGGGGGTAAFNTVSLTAESTASSPFDSDVAKHTDASTVNCGDPSVDTVTVTPDDIDVTVTSTAVPGLPSSITPSDVRLSSVTIKYTSATNPASPSIPDQHYALSNIIPAGSSATVSVRIASQAMKTSPPLDNLVCGGGIYSYFVTLTFHGIEVISEEEASFQTNLSINFADFAD